MHSCVLNMNLFSSFALVFEYCAISGIWEMTKTDPPEKPNAKLLKELKKMIYIKMHFQIRKRAKLLLVNPFNKGEGPTCRYSFSAVSKALMLSNGAFFAE